jgi:hypothetical protein
MQVDSTERTIVYDSEANGLLDREDLRMWCVVAQDYHTEELFLFHDFPEYCGQAFSESDGLIYKLPKRSGTLKDGVRFVSRAKSIICHNQCGYDQLLMKRFFPKFRIRYNWPEVRDTLCESTVQWFDRGKIKGQKGVHGLAAWGVRVGIHKPEIKDWSFMDAKKLYRCLEDVKINTKVAKALAKERKVLKEECGITFDQALNTEQEYSYNCAIQEVNGALVDVPHMEECIKELDVLIEDARCKIEPNLPPSLTVKSTKASSQEVQKLLGVPEDRWDRVRFKKDSKGKITDNPIRNLYRPVTNFTSKKVTTLYSVMVNKEAITGFDFVKLKDARDFKDQLCLSKKDKVAYPSKKTTIESIKPQIKEYFGEELIEKGKIKIVGPFTKIQLTSSKMSQHEKVKLLLVSLGWQTDEWTYEKDSEGNFVKASADGVVYWPNYKVNGNQLIEHYKRGKNIPKSPRLNPDSFETLPEGIGQTVAEFNTYSHRRKFIKNPTKGDKGLLNNLREDGRISCGLIPFGTSAGRAAQTGWVNAPSVQALYGEQIRKIVIASKGCTLVGVDMPSAHPRILADPYCTGNEKFIAAVDGLEDDPITGEYYGEDFHTVNAVLFGLIKEDQVILARKKQLSEVIALLSKGRKLGKGGSYCILYGGSDKKLAIILKIPEEEGAKIKQNFLSGLGLDKLLEKEEEMWEKQSFKKGAFISVLGGYHIYSNSKHKIINYKALGSEAVIQKYAVNWICKEIVKQNIGAKLIINVHDELLFDVNDEDLDRFLPIASKVYDVAAKSLGLSLNWVSQAKKGKTYAACH